MANQTGAIMQFDAKEIKCLMHVLRHYIELLENIYNKNYINIRHLENAKLMFERLNEEITLK